jgi:hypothetical protein
VAGRKKSIVSHASCQRRTNFRQGRQRSTNLHDIRLLDELFQFGYTQTTHELELLLRKGLVPLFVVVAVSVLVLLCVLGLRVGFVLLLLVPSINNLDLLQKCDSAVKKNRLNRDSQTASSDHKADDFVVRFTCGMRERQEHIPRPLVGLS